MAPWQELVQRIKRPDDELTIHVVGKYTGYEDSYKSLNEALYHGGFAHRLRINIQWVEAEALEQDGGMRLLEGSHGILVPGGFGSRGTRGMMKAPSTLAITRCPISASATGSSGRPWSSQGTCMLEGADSTEVDEAAPHRVIYKLRDLLGVDDLGGTMPWASTSARRTRLACSSDLRNRPDLRASSPSLRVQLSYRADAARAWDARIRTRSPDGKFVEIAELPGHLWFVAVQFHPEFVAAAPPHPLFASFVSAA